ncbi:MAG: RNA-binding protein [Syntrophus sp. (in: bacteria)]
MVKKLYIGNLADDVTEDDLRANFGEIGEIVSLVIIRDKITGMSRGFGFVEMSTEQQAEEAVQKFNGGELLGRTIRVNEAKPKGEGDERPRSPGGPGRRPGGFSGQPPRSGGGGNRGGGSGGGGRRP